MGAPTELDPKDSKFLSRLTRETRSHPESFREGADLLEGHFRFEVIRNRMKAEWKQDLAEAHEANRQALQRERDNDVAHLYRMLLEEGMQPRKAKTRADARAKEPLVGQIPILTSMLEMDREKRFPYTRTDARHALPRDESLAWACERGPQMSRVEALAVCLVAVFFYDNSETPNPALPACLREIPWGDPNKNVRDRTAFVGTWFHIAMHGFDAKLMTAARHAWNRLQATTPFDVGAESAREPARTEKEANTATMADGGAPAPRASLNETERAVLDALTEAQSRGVGLQTKELMKICKRSDDAVYRAIKGLTEKKYPITNLHNRAGYVLNRAQPRG